MCVFDTLGNVYTGTFPDEASTQTVTDAQAFAVQQGITPCHHVLIPRFKGFVDAVTALRTHPDATSARVVDVTMAFVRDDGSADRYATYKPLLDGSRHPPTLADVFGDHPPTHAYVHVRDYALRDLPEPAAKLRQWLLERFMEKESLLQSFQTNGRFPGPTFDQVATLPMQWIALWWLAVLALVVAVFGLLPGAVRVLLLTLTLFCAVGGLVSQSILNNA